MSGWQYAMWGLFGGFCVEGLEFVGAVRRTGDWPWRRDGEPSALPLMVSVIIRLAISTGLAAAAGSTHQVSGPFGAVGVGVAAPLLVEQLLQPFQLADLASTRASQLAAPHTPSISTWIPGSERTDQTVVLHDWSNASGVQGEGDSGH
jgi:hypothetical protein